MFRTLVFSSLLNFMLFSTASFAMDTFDPLASPTIHFKCPEELDALLKEDKDVSLAVACHLNEMEHKIVAPRAVGQWLSFDPGFSSPVPPVENWISLDLNDCHIQMNADNIHHWEQLAHYLNEKKVKLRTVALTIQAPRVSSPIIDTIILPLMKEGGTVIYPECFRISAISKFTSNKRGPLYSHMYGWNFKDGLLQYYNCQKNTKALIEWAMKWMNEENTQSIMQPRVGGQRFSINPVEPEKRLTAKVFANYVASVKPEYLDKLTGNFKTDINQTVAKLVVEKVISSTSTFKGDFLFTKSEQEFTEDFFVYFKDYMEELGFKDSNYKIYATKECLCKGVEEYTYPNDGTFDFTGYFGQPSLVLFK